MIDLIHKEMDKTKKQRDKYIANPEGKEYSYYQGVVMGYSQAALIVMNSVPLNPQDQR